MIINKSMQNISITDIFIVKVKTKFKKAYPF